MKKTMHVLANCAKKVAHMSAGPRCIMNWNQPKVPASLQSKKAEK